MTRTVLTIGAIVAATALVLHHLTRMETRMATLDEKIQQINDSLAELGKDLDRAVAQLRDLLAGNLTPEAAAKLDEITAKISTLDQGIEAVSPEAVEPTEPDTGDQV